MSKSGAAAGMQATRALNHPYRRLSDHPDAAGAPINRNAEMLIRGETSRGLTPAPHQPSMISDLLVRMNEAINDLAERIESFEGRLQPILRPADGVLAKNDVPATLSSVGSAIAEFTGRIEYLRRRVVDAHERVDL